MLARAPRPASKPDQASRFTSSLSIGGSVYSSRGGARVQPAADRLHHEPLGLLVLVLATRKQVEDPRREDLLDRPVEGHGGVLRRDGGLERSLRLGPLDDSGDPVVGLADLDQVRAPE